MSIRDGLEKKNNIHMYICIIKFVMFQLLITRAEYDLKVDTDHCE